MSSASFSSGDNIGGAGGGNSVTLSFGSAHMTLKVSASVWPLERCRSHADTAKSMELFDLLQLERSDAFFRVSCISLKIKIKII